ncbi:TrmH family RNA methyltransferase [Salinicoccus halodurans]|uniref:RNA methyltransferase, TrmH family n=1 Tax=Salinicoccus halodurans TaxID=407035 RepID=A0AA94HJR5_9STAP|nr:RNA methyltransferase [Salinicoccus halodurans]SFK93226.1 RNA methyltransferase, TrmH family [Salinicoccus halodurans]
MVEKEIITSKDNRRIKDLRKLHKKKYRGRLNRFLIEGEHLVEEAVIYNQTVHTVILSEDYVSDGLDVKNRDLMFVSRDVMKSLSLLETPPGIMAEVSYSPPESSGQRVLLLDCVQDPGNLGTLIRTADAFGFDKVVLSPDTVDVFSEKVLRSAQGSTFHIDIVVEEAAGAVRGFEGTVLGTALHGALPLGDIDVPAGPLMLVLGNEGSGVSSEVLSTVDLKVKIEMSGQSESLNVGIAGGILMHHFRA